MTAPVEENPAQPAEETDETSRHRERPVLLGLLLIVLVACCWIALAQTSIVPDVVGMSEQDARTAAERAGFSVETSAVPLPSDANAQTGVIVAQSPRAGMRALRGTTMILSVPGEQSASGGPDTGAPKEGYLPPAEEGTGIGEPDDTGDENVPGNIGVSSGSGPIVPLVGNMTEAEAIGTLTAAGYHAIIGGRGPTTAGVLAGRIYLQNPAGGARAARGSTVTLWVSTGSPMSSGYEQLPYPGPTHP